MFVVLDIKSELEPAVIVEVKRLPSHNHQWAVRSQRPSCWQKGIQPQDHENDQFDYDPTCNLLEWKMTPYQYL